MSVHSDEPQPGVSSDSFWEPGNYKRTAKRIEDGYKLCVDLAQMVAERAEMEKAYAKGLKGWAKKWSDLIEKGPEYGTMEAAWKGVLVESERLCDLHIKVKDNLYNNVIQELKNWQKESYHKSMIQIKERKEMEDAFKKAQKPWCKLLGRVERARAEYHTACKQQRSAANQERNAAGDTSLSPDQRSATVKKMQERVTKSREDAARWREKYEAALKEIDAYNGRYMEDMGQVFEKCQTMEAQRLIYFKQLLFSVHKCLNVSQDPGLPQIYEEFHHTINNADHQKDLKWWSNNHGVNMAMAWPQFEEYTEEFRDIAKGKSKESLPAGPITLINQRPVGEDLHSAPEIGVYTLKKNKELPPSNNKTTSAPTKSGGVSAVTTLTNSKEKVDKSDISAPTTADKKPTISSPQKTITNGTGPARNSTTSTAISTTNSTSQSAAVNAANNKNNESNPFEEEEWDEDGSGENEVDGAAEPLTDTGEPGVPVRALYDYQGAESDELSFRQGDLFEKLEDEDEQGWCKGRKDGRVGLYPANYVEPVGH